MLGEMDCSLSVVVFCRSKPSLHIVWNKVWRRVVNRVMEGVIEQNVEYYMEQVWRGYDTWYGTRRHKDGPMVRIGFGKYVHMDFHMFFSP